MNENLQTFRSQVIEYGTSFGKSLIAAIVIYFVGMLLIRLIKKITKTVMERRKIDPTVQTFLTSMINILLLILLIICVLGALGVETTSFAALLASAGVALGMALSGNIQNFAGGIAILLLRPYKVGDYIEAQGKSGTVKSIQIFNTTLATVDNKIITIPNSSINSNVIVNYSQMENRRVDLSIGVDYGTDYNKARAIIQKLIDGEARALKTPESFIGLGELADNSINITVRIWTKSEDYWDVYFDMTKAVYETFNEEGISFAYPQVVVHKA